MITADINRAQLVLLAQCLLFGVGAGLVYDVFRALRRGGAGEGVCDALFCAVTLAAAFRFGLVSAAGQWRLFALAGAAAGGAIYFALLSGFACRGRTVKKSAKFAKKFAKPSSLFREKGIK